MTDSILAQLKHFIYEAKTMEKLEEIEERVLRITSNEMPIDKNKLK